MSRKQPGLTPRMSSPRARTRRVRATAAAFAVMLLVAWAAPALGQDGGTMVVNDVSRNGLSIRVNDATYMKIGDILEVNFKLDDAKRSPIQKEVVIRKIVGYDIGTEFFSIDAGNASDKAIGFYLMG